MKHSYSRLSSFIRCPLAYKLTYLDRLPQARSGPMTLGGICHDFFEAYDRHLAAQRLATDHAAAERIMSEVFLKFERPLPAELYDEYRAICLDFVQTHVLDLDTFVGAEVQIAITRAFAVCAWDADDVWFRFKLDRLDKDGGRAIITDYKTGWGGEADPFQTLLYAVAVWILNAHTPIKPETGDIQVIETALLYTRSGRQNQWAFSPDKIRAGMEKMVDYADRVEQEQEWKANPGTACNGCSFAGTSHCREKVRDWGQIRSQADAIRAAEEFLTLNAQMKTRKDALKDWVRGHGPLTAKADVFDFGGRENYHVIDALGFVEAIKKAGYSPLDFYDIDTTGLKKRCQQDPGLADVVAPFVSVENKETFGHRAAPKRDPFKNQAAPTEPVAPTSPGGTDAVNSKASTSSATEHPAAPGPGARHPAAARHGLARFGGASGPGGGDRQAGPAPADVTPGPSAGDHHPARLAPAAGPEVGSGADDPLGRGPGGGRHRPF